MVEANYSKIRFRKRKTLVVESKVCSGCRTCETICAITHEGCIDLEKSRIDLKSNAFKGSFIPRICRQCADAPCYYACPESAIQIADGDGTVRIIEEKCTGCRSCESACPYQMIRFDGKKDVAFKCDFCNGTPQCVAWCPMNALGTATFGGPIPK